MMARLYPFAETHWTLRSSRSHVVRLSPDSKGAGVFPYPPYSLLCVIPPVPPVPSAAEGSEVEGSAARDLLFLFPVPFFSVSLCICGNV